MTLPPFAPSAASTLLQTGVTLPTPTSLSGRIALTVVAALVVVSVAYAVSRLQAHDAPVPGIPDLGWHFVLSLVNVAVFGLGLLVVLETWGLIAQFVALTREYGVGPDSVVKLAASLVVLVGAYALTSVLGRITKEITESRTEISDHQREIAFRIAQVTLYVVAFAVVLGLWNVRLGGLLVGAGFLGIVVGMAARQTLGALIAGFVLMFSRPFEIGDWIQVGEYEGIVTDITVVTTRIQTFDGEYVMVPNDVVSGESIVNRSRKGRLRFEVEVGVDYEADAERAAEVAREAVSDLDETLGVPSPQVVLKRFGDSAVVLGVRVWIDRPSARRKWRAQTAVVSAVKDAFEREGIKIPFPQRELMGRTEAGGFELAGDPPRPAETAATDGDGTGAGEASRGDGA